MLLELMGEGPLYTRVYGTLRQHILEGRFPPGERLPGTRSIAEALGVSRTVVLQAYAQLEGEGYTTTRVGSGTYVVDVPPVHEAGRLDASAPSLSDDMDKPPEVPLSRLATRMPSMLADDLPDELSGSGSGVIDLTDTAASYDVRGLKAWRQILVRAMDSLPPDPPGPAGARPLCEAMLEYLHHERGVVANIEDVIIVNSAQQARNLIARVLADEQAVVGVEEPCNPGVRSAFAATGAHVLACKVDADGLDIGMHASTLSEARVLHVAPTCHLPSGAAMPAARREALLAWAYARPTWIVEEDVDCDYRHGVRTMPALVSLDRHERVIYYLSGFVRTVYPALQMSCVVVPPALREKFLAIKELSDRDDMALRQHAWAHYLAEGEYLRGLRRLSQQLARKHQIFMDALYRHFGTSIEVQGLAVSGQLLAHLKRLDATWMTVLREEAMRVGLLLQSAADWFFDKPAHVTLLLHYAAVPETLLDAAVERLALAWRRALADVAQVARRRA
ncbi:MAG TPA: PLP-dependent aminotransferase family protein [Rhodanobacteraceae bacterium]